MGVSIPQLNEPRTWRTRGGLIPLWLSRSSKRMYIRGAAGLCAPSKPQRNEQVTIVDETRRGRLYRNPPEEEHLSRASSLRYQGGKGKRHGTIISPREDTAPLHLALPGLDLGLAPTSTSSPNSCSLTRSGGIFPKIGMSTE
ncbi:hypothetical protein ASPTUDRAFT_45140 [Aspergillus tubingensis CBS 134.48]|uniref:Uncharacterized protein n=1 Tax=Aspergillus tubingensis (strain CBS 134.48) TaxID=767770 RepID=A0A1L9MXS7_ASPTC|nr:hypothetical protein ASPTUDRAFT_45140 [Aspergillus tubingensis CBS 134.48]